VGPKEGKGHSTYLPSNKKPVNRRGEKRKDQEKKQKVLKSMPEEGRVPFVLKENLTAHCGGGGVGKGIRHTRIKLLIYDRTDSGGRLKSPSEAIKF